MDIRTRRILVIEEMECHLRKFPRDKKYFKQVPYQRSVVKTGRNEQCPCGSGVKFKKCCLHKPT